MLQPDGDLDERLLKQVVQRQYPGAGPDLCFQPVGADSWAYRCGDLWISVRRDFLGHFPGAYETAHALNRAGLDFVLAPLAGRDGRILRTVQGRPVAVYPYLPGEPVATGEPLNAREVARLAELVGRVHACDVPTPLPPEEFRLPFEEVLIRSLARAVEPDRDAGPYSARLRALVRANSGHITGLLRQVAEAGRRFASAQHVFGVTHGDLTAENVLRVEGELVIADWQCAMNAPAERDGYFLAREFSAPPRGDSGLHHFYDLQWQLAEIAEYTTTFTSAHEDSSDQQGRWRRLCSYLASP